MPASWGCWTHDRDALIPVGDHRIFQGMIVFFTTVIVFLLGVTSRAQGSRRAGAGRKKTGGYLARWART